ncbi:MAG TPA: class I SAM-dependent methyltransferase [Solirubrobacteraceae bacterium]|nr:class I SAM-dependent methyltransferase [Solirubrobacteraceae bacterium]
MKDPGEEDVNRRYFVDWVTRVAPPGARVLDYGCGAGTLTRMFQDAGLDAYGCDIRWPGAGYSWDESTAQGKLRYFESGGTLPFDDDFFDVVVSDQVFEHVEPLHASVAEIERITKPDGLMYHHFPASEVWREGHIGIPLSHRLPPGRVRLRYTELLRRLGVGIYKDERPAREWAEEKLRWIDDWTVYRRSIEIHQVFGRHADITHREIDYCRFRAGEHGWLRRLLDIPQLVPIAQFAFRRLAFMAIECRPRIETPSEAAPAPRLPVQ